MNHKIVTVPFDRNKIPPKQNMLIIPLLWLTCWAVTRKGKLKIHKINMEGLKPPYLVLGTHHAFMDFFVTPLALFPRRANYVSELEGFEQYSEWCYRQIGCLGTRKFVTDSALVRNIKRVMDRRGILVLYPEARYANVGTSSILPFTVGKLCKFLKVPVVTINMHGNYLQSPIWNVKTRKGVRLEAVITQLFTQKQLEETSAEDIQFKIQEALTYDEYAWQYETKQAISYSKRAEGLELPLYQCRICKQEFTMASEHSDLFCKACGSRWHMTQYGRLVRTNDSIHIPDWYEWERECVKQEIDAGAYTLEVRVSIESLPNAVNFIDLGQGTLQHNLDGFALTFIDYGKTDEKTLYFSVQSTFSVHTEYDYRGKGQCITLSTLDNTYFLYPQGEGFNATKIQFATEYLHKISKGRQSGL